MEISNFFARLTGCRAPGRISIKTIPLSTPVERWKQADVLTDYLIMIHNTSCSTMESQFNDLCALSFDDLISDEQQIFYESFKITQNLCYPYIFIEDQSIRAANRQYRRKQQRKEFLPEAYAIILRPRDYFSTIAEPNILRLYIRQQLFLLLKQGLQIEAGLSVVPVPLPYAVERSHIQERTKGDKELAREIQPLFPMPSLAEIEDSIADANHKRRDQVSFVNREFELADSLFWRTYREYLRPLAQQGEETRDLVRGDRWFKSTEIYADWKRVDVDKTWAQVISFALENKKKGLVEFEEIPTRVRDNPKSAASSVPSDMSFATPKPISFFDAWRTDYSVSRLRHYTHTDPEYFRKYVLFTNYEKYVQRFIVKGLLEILAYFADPEQPHQKKPFLVIPPTKRTDNVNNGGLKIDTENIFDLFGGRETLEELRRAVETIQNYGEGPIDVPEPIEQATVDGEGEDSNSADELREQLQRQLADARSAYDTFVAGQVRPKLITDAQMPTYHFSGRGVRQQSTVDPARMTHEAWFNYDFKQQPMPSLSLVNIGVGPSNARNITDHLAVLRPLGWMMVGHCGGLRTRQKLGDYVLAESYVRRDGVLDGEVPLDTAVKSSARINRAIRLVHDHVYRPKPKDLGTGSIDSFGLGLGHLNDDVEIGSDFAEAVGALAENKREVRSGCVMTTMNRNWETSPTEDVFEEFERYRVVAVDMESGTIGANAYRYRIPHASFLCVSDRPLHGEMKMRYFSDDFYRDQIDRHMDIAIDSIRFLESYPTEPIRIENTRELRSLDDPPWR